MISGKNVYVITVVSTTVFDVWFHHTNIPPQDLSLSWLTFAFHQWMLFKNADKQCSSYLMTGSNSENNEEQGPNSLRLFVNPHLTTRLHFIQFYVGNHSDCDRRQMKRRSTVSYSIKTPNDVNIFFNAYVEKGSHQFMIYNLGSMHRTYPRHAGWRMICAAI